jgi:cell volume regulation protein A
MLAGVPNAELYFNLVFFIVLTSVLLQGTTIPLVARWLGLDAPLSPKRQYPLEFVPTPKTTSEMIEIAVPENSPVVGKRIVDLQLPRSALVVLIGRHTDFLSPRGATVLRGGDTMLVLVDKQEIDVLRGIMEVAGPRP